MTGASLLRQYLRKTQQSIATFSRVSGIDDGQLSRWTRGERRPGLDNAERLERLTDGLVPATAWMKARSRAA